MFRSAGDYVESWQPHPMSATALQRSPRHRTERSPTALGGTGPVRRRTLREGRRGLVLRSQPAPARHRHGDHDARSGSTEFELHARAILGLPVDASLRNPGASAVIYGGVEARGIVYEGLADALALPGTEVRLFGKPESFNKRRMGVALARAADIDTARSIAKQAAARVKPRAA